MTGLADEGVRPLHRRDTTLVMPAKPVPLLSPWEQMNYPDVIGPLVREHLRRIEAHQKNLAMLLFGVHL